MKLSKLSNPINNDNIFTVLMNVKNLYLLEINEIAVVRIIIVVLFYKLSLGLNEVEL